MRLVWSPFLVLNCYNECMPGEQHEEYAAKVYRAIEFIEEHLTEPFTLDHVCRHVAVSKFYFTRIFQATLGETVFDYARRRRLTEISRELLAGEEAIIDLSFSYGYESQQSMTKAFRRQFHLTPGQYRAAGEERFFFRRERVSPEEIRRISRMLSFDTTVVRLPELRIVGLRQTLPIADPEPVEAIRSRFRRLAPSLERRKRHRGLFEVTIMSEDEMLAFSDESRFDGLIGFSLTKDDGNPPGLDELLIPSRRYLSLRYTGDTAIESLSTMYRHVFSTGLLRRRETLVPGSFFHYYPGAADRMNRGPREARVLLPVEG